MLYLNGGNIDFVYCNSKMIPILTTSCIHVYDYHCNVIPSPRLYLQVAVSGSIHNGALQLECIHKGNQGSQAAELNALVDLSDLQYEKIQIRHGHSYAHVKHLHNPITLTQ